MWTSMPLLMRTLPECHTFAGTLISGSGGVFFLQGDDTEAMLATVWRFCCLAPVITTLGVLRNVGLSCSPLLPPLSVSARSVSPPLSKQGISLTFLFFSQGYSSIFHSGAHIPSQIPDCALLDAKTLRLLQGTVRITDLSTGQSAYQWLSLWLLLHKPVVLLYILSDRWGSNDEATIWRKVGKDVEVFTGLSEKLAQRKRGKSIQESHVFTVWLLSVCLRSYSLRQVFLARESWIKREKPALSSWSW